MQFFEPVFMGTELSASVPVRLLLGRGTSIYDIAVTVSSLESSPLSARGENFVKLSY